MGCRKEEGNHSKSEKRIEQVFLPHSPCGRTKESGRKK
jgi:hypothetical protein